MRGSSRFLLRSVFGFLLILSVMSILMILFSGQVGMVDERRNALLLAGQVVAGWEDRGWPDTGIHDSTVVSGDRGFRIRRVVTELLPGVREMRLLISSEERTSIELVRRFYDDGSARDKDWRRI